MAIVTCRAFWFSPGLHCDSPGVCKKLLYAGFPEKRRKGRKSERKNERKVENLRETEKESERERESFRERNSREIMRGQMKGKKTTEFQVGQSRTCEAVICLKKTKHISMLSSDALAWR